MRAAPLQLQALGARLGAALLLHACGPASPCGASCYRPGAAGLLGATRLGAQSRHAHPTSPLAELSQHHAYIPPCITSLEQCSRILP